jgi:hypothetical protein
MATTHKGECFCGTVHVEVTGEPEAMGYCHCRSCRSWSGGPVNAFTLWKPGTVRVTAGAEHVAMFKKTEVSERQYCTKCGGHLMTNHPPLGLVDVFAATLPTVKFAPGVHVNYADSTADEGRTHQVEGLPQRIWWLGRSHAGVTERSRNKRVNGLTTARCFEKRRTS